MDMNYEFGQVLLGCDPELFIVDDSGSIVSCEGLLPGTKTKPYPVEGGAVQVDGFAAEFNIEPAATLDEWESRITGVWAQLNDMLPSGHWAVPIASTVFSEEIYGTAKAKTKALGCEPDFNAWTGTMTKKPTPPPRFRTCGGHVHIGWRSPEKMSNQHWELCRNFVKQLDWFLGAWSVLEDGDTERRKLYGAAGCFRPKAYGVEYRTLSNFWVATPELRAEVWNRTQAAIAAMSKSPLFAEEAGLTNLVEAINTSNRGAAAELLEEFLK